MKIHYVEIRVFVGQEEDVEQVKRGLLKFAPFDLKKEKIKLVSKNTSGFNEKKIVILSIRLEKARHTNRFIEHLNSMLDEKTRATILTQAESRLDKELHFFLRFDKQNIISENKFTLTDRGDCYHLKIGIASFPKTRENTLEIIKELF